MRPIDGVSTVVGCCNELLKLLLDSIQCQQFLAQGIDLAFDGQYVIGVHLQLDAKLLNVRVEFSNLLCLEVVKQRELGRCVICDRFDFVLAVDVGMEDAA